MLSTNLHNRNTGLIFAIGAATLWAITTPLIKYGLSFGITPINFAGLRFTIAGIILIIYSAHKGMFGTIKRNIKIFLNVILLNMFLGYSLFYIGVDFISAATSSVMIGMSPIINIILAHIIAKDDKLSKKKIICIIVSILGLLLVLGNWGISNNNLPKGNDIVGWKGWLGILFLLSNIVLQGFSSIKISEYKKEKIDPIFLNAVQMLIGGILIYMLGVSVEGYHPILNKPLGFYLSLLSLILVSVLSFSFWFIALGNKFVKVSELNICKLIQPVLGATISWLFIANESPTISSISGIILIVGIVTFYFTDDLKLGKRHKCKR